MVKKYDIEERTFDFSVNVIKTVLGLPRNIATWKLGGQLISSVSSINSNIIHAQSGISRKDFINHLKIARKEAKETKRWIEMLIAIGFVNRSKIDSLLIESEEIIKILVSIIKKSEANTGANF